MVSLNITSNSELGYRQGNNDVETFLQTVGHHLFATLKSFTACLTAFQALSARKCFMYRKAIERKAKDQPFVHQWVQYGAAFELGHHE